MDIYKCPKLKKIIKLYFTKNEHRLFYGGSRATFAIINNIYIKSITITRSLHIF